MRRKIGVIFIILVLFSLIFCGCIENDDKGPIIDDTESDIKEKFRQFLNAHSLISIYLS